MRLLDYVKEDWLIRLPYRLDANRYRGWSRPAFGFFCIVYYCLKSLLLLYFLLAFVLYKFFLWDIWNRLFKIDQREWFLRFTERFHSDEEYEWIDNGDEEYEVDEEETEEGDDDIEELPFCQLFQLGKEMCLMVDHVEMCPDENAFIRVVDDEGYTPLYKRKVRHDKLGGRYIVFNGQNLYLKDEKTRPIIKP